MALVTALVVAAPAVHAGAAAAAPPTRQVEKQPASRTLPKPDAKPLSPSRTGGASRTLGAPRRAAAAAPAAPAVVGTKLAWQKGRAPQLLWTGFRAKGGVGEVLLQVSSDVELVERTGGSGGESVFVLKGCRTLRRTDRLPLETQFFDSSVKRVELSQHAHDLQVAVTLRAPIGAVPRKEAGPDGSWFWVIQFPAKTSPTTTASVAD